jgi:hypothetical protein
MLLLVTALVSLHGLVTIGPTTPVCRVDVPCSKPAGNVTLTFSRPGRVLHALTDAHGRYRLSLPAGTWNVRASAGMSMKPARIVVPAVPTAMRNFSIDTGIR